MRSVYSSLLVFLFIVYSLIFFVDTAFTQGQAKISSPPSGYLYHGVFPGPEGASGEENLITLKSLEQYESAVGKKVAWVYFSQEWAHDQRFPLETVSWIHDHGSIPFIRLMLRSTLEHYTKEKIFTLEKIIRGDFDEALHAWGRAAHTYHFPLLVEYGTEVNGEWFSWNARWYGKKGAERFKKAYRHIIQTMKDENAHNITWVFHANNQDVPDEPWNHFEEYYPGDDVIDWIGVSVYGAQTPVTEEWPSFQESLDAIYPRLVSLASGKPIVLLEFGVTSSHPLGDQAYWAEEALKSLSQCRWPEVIGFSWWNEAWKNDDNPTHDTDMRVQDNPDLTRVFHDYVGHNDHVLDEAIFTTE
ncbi:MAG: glycosyl hydrolase [Candidatus Atribacteria bacterium]|nr:glycosyl hydrolase [Candidatus Atribacteria bacterium]